MSADPVELYPVIAQIAGAFAGFGSLASGLGRRRGGDDARVDASRLSMMLQVSLSATFLGLLPATFFALSFGDPWSLRGAAIAALAIFLANAPSSTRRSIRFRKLPGFSRSTTVLNALCLLAAVAGFVACALGAPGELLAGSYLLGLMGLLSSSIVMFSRVIGSILRPHSEADVDAS
jgi:hypothetical protein